MTERSPRPYGPRDDPLPYPLQRERELRIRPSEPFDQTAGPGTRDQIEGSPRPCGPRMTTITLTRRRRADPAQSIAAALREHRERTDTRGRPAGCIQECINSMQK